MQYKYYELDNRQEFLSKVCTLEYKQGDEDEAKALGFPSVSFLYHNTFAPYMKYYIVEDNEKNIICTIVLRRDGSLEYFITNHLTANKVPTMVRTMKQLADETTAKVDVVFTTTLESYEGAISFNEMVGFRKIKTDGKFSTWAYDKNYVNPNDGILSIEQPKRTKKKKVEE